ncbi:FAD-dependent monooxygenase [Dactylosporangium sp. NPDC050688]|uniref:FAD-dependent monooxygenase n=1 Tax=Dactylosporangium sp. NPDC050688 TaxID=3157217 RepID=UPI0033D8B3EF
MTPDPRTPADLPCAVDVLVIGAGPTGLALGYDLLGRGVDTLVVDLMTHRASHPKAKFVNLRSMALLRRWGLAERLRAAAPIPPDHPSDVHYVTALTGEVIASVPDAFPTGDRAGAAHPEPALRIPQPVFEDVLEAALRARSGERLPVLGWRMELLRQHRDWVEATLVEVGTGRTRRVRARYVVGADGGRSTVRASIDAVMIGRPALARSVGAVFRAPTLSERLTAGPGVHYWVVDDNLPTTPGFGPLDLRGMWFFQAMGVPEGFPADAETAAAIIRTAIGDDLPFEVIDVAPWTVHHLQADRYRRSRVFLAGDAAHLHPPTGGFGMNMGLADAVDLSWKLAAVLGGWGGPGLLGSYELERRPVHSRTMEQSVRNFGAVDLRTPVGGDPVQWRRQLGERLAGPSPRYFDSVALQVGYHYEGSPLVSPEPAASSAVDTAAYLPSAAPGHLLPHAWLADRSSTLDMLGEGFTLLTYHDATTGPVRQAAEARQIPMRVAAYHDKAVRALLGRDLVLVRPDQHVAWRGDDITLAVAALDTATGHAVTAAAATPRIGTV